MNPRQRGASILLGLLLAGRALDAFDLPWQTRAADGAASRLETSSAQPPGALADSTIHPNGDTRSPAAAALGAAETAPAQQVPLNINSAGERQLQALPGVGPVLAGRIVAFRQEHGAFANMAALRQVKGVGPRMVERLAPLLRFD